MGTHTHKTLRCVAASRAGRIAIAAASVAIWTEANGANAADTPAPSAAKLERITDFFDNEVATEVGANALTDVVIDGERVGEERHPSASST